MKNITITLDAETAAWVRVQAAEQNKSVSRFVGEYLQTQMKDRREYQRAYASASCRSRPSIWRQPGEVSQRGRRFMTALVFVDTNVFVYARDPRDPAKQAKARDWLGLLWERQRGRTSMQVLNEFYDVAHPESAVLP